MDAHVPLAFESPRAEWLELWEAPLRYRATKLHGKVGPGTSIATMQEFGRNPRFEPFYRVSIDPDDGGAVIIEWLIGLPGSRPPFQSARYYNGGPGRGYTALIENDPAVRAQALAHLPAEYHDRAIGAFNIAITLREWMETEFFTAVEAGLCVVWARVGSKIAPFHYIPADVFRAYQISSWGYDQRGAATAHLQGAPSLYAIQVAPPLDQKIVQSSLDAPSERSKINLPMPPDEQILEQMLSLCREMSRDDAANIFDRSQASRALETSMLAASLKENSQGGAQKKGGKRGRKRAYAIIAAL